jgi:6,7-dimethyl-8-ribityllumazine synthase
MLEKVVAPRGTRVAVVAARWNAEIVDELLAGCARRLKELGLKDAAVEVHRVPGAYELPFAAKVLAGKKGTSAVIALGCVIRGDTPHFDYVAGECARGIMQLNVTGKVPVFFGVLTVNTEEQARERTGGKHGHNGARAAEAAVEMVLMARKASAR